MFASVTPAGVQRNSQKTVDSQLADSTIQTSHRDNQMALDSLCSELSMADDNFLALPAKKKHEKFKRQDDDLSDQFSQGQMSASVRSNRAGSA